MYELKLEQFTGPIEKLLDLIEERKLEITELNLAEVTADFLTYLDMLTDADGTQTNVESGVSVGQRSVRVSPRLLADFIVVASQLLLIKSKALLPNFQLTGEEEKDVKDLQNRLHFYRQFKPAMGHLKKLWEQNNISISRPLFSGRPAFFYPADNIKINDLYKLVKGIFETIQQLSEKSQTIKSSLITLEEKIEEIMNRLGPARLNDVSHSGRPDLNFGKLAKEKPRSEIIVLFLALLHLLAKQLIKVEQKKQFSDIMIEKR